VPLLGQAVGVFATSRFAGLPDWQHWVNAMRLAVQGMGVGHLVTQELSSTRYVNQSLQTALWDWLEDNSSHIHTAMMRFVQQMAERTRDPH
jgi:hypothetical protein